MKEWACHAILPNNGEFAKGCERGSLSALHMKKVKLIYNPNAGDKSFRLSLDACVAAFENAGYETHLLRLQEGIDLASLAENVNAYDLLTIAGGDGTVNQALNLILPGDITVPIAFLPTGTANDFASFLKIPAVPEEAVAALVNGKEILCDVGVANGRYFINVCGSGVFVNISELVDSGDKDALGKYAYYLKGIEQLPNWNPFLVRIKTRDRVIKESVHMYFILNSSGVGGFTNVTHASIDDGLFELIAVKAIPVLDLAKLFVKLYKGGMIDDNRVIYLQSPYFYVENLSPDSPYQTTGVDGEKGPVMPVEVENLQRKIKLLVPREGCAG